ncbi:hypothetical protein [Bailinhaonella thermotolerans]|uniref:Uncharacterized protein n=1 Tax=Bailinhaonella thermotolerans TaxID=1070861 RepID=A0A3A4B4U3_9ACTN|nr:hypothetical protein [Bailinhaonella thermotolerans]RJL26562.1 hypothetical protein D5H75_26645 [Bailinhaonella thermotolerans]
MNTTLLAWAVSAGGLVLVALLASLAIRRGLLGILIDSRGRYSLTHFQAVVWTFVVFSLISGVFWGRYLAGEANPLEFVIPGELFGALGISLGSAMIAGVIKGSKDSLHPEGIAASEKHRDPPRWAQVYLLEQGPLADRVIDVTKFQNFVITIILVAAYGALTAREIAAVPEGEVVKALPEFSTTFLTLLAISHAGYLAGKLPVPPTGVPTPGLTVADLSTDAPVERPRNAPRRLSRTAPAGARHRSRQSPEDWE